MNAFEKAANEHGTVTIQGVEYALLVEAYPSDLTNVENAYIATAFSCEMMDENGEHDPTCDETVKIAWDVLEGMESCDDASAACDWENGAYQIS